MLVGELSLLVVLATACEGPESFLDTAGPAAEEIAGLWWIMFALGLGVYAVVMGFVAVPIWRRWRRRRGPPSDERDLIVERRFLGGVIGGSIVILFSLYLVAAPVLVSTSPSGQDHQDITVDVIGRQFWWEVRYPDHDVITANEIHIPAGRTVRFRITSGDVIHAFWIPRLHGKVDMTPGHTTELVVTADEPGHYRGRCTEYCGIAHAQMILHVYAHEPGEFEEWMEELADEPETDGQDEGRAVFASHCAACHTVRGDFPSSPVGPDLSDFALRQKLASGVVDNDRENLRRWILDPHDVKPGAAMPATRLERDDLEALLDYLESLR